MWWGGVGCRCVGAWERTRTGALPGADQGLKRNTSATVPGAAFWLAVRYFGSSRVKFLGVSGQWSQPGILVPLLSHCLQPMVQPCENQKQLWPELHSLVPLAQRQLYGWIVPVIGCLRASSKTSENLRAALVVAFCSCVERVSMKKQSHSRTAPLPKLERT